MQDCTSIPYIELVISTDRRAIYLESERKRRRRMASQTLKHFTHFKVDAFERDRKDGWPHKGRNIAAIEEAFNTTHKEPTVERGQW